MKKPDRELTNLELTALGIVWKTGGCTAYDVLTEFSGSLTAQFHSGAGSVYPLIKRLHQDGYLKQKSVPRGKQSRSLYTITAKGRKVLVNWMSPPVDEAAALTADPIRTRIYFLEILPVQEQLAFLDDVQNRLSEQWKHCENVTREYRQQGNQYGVMAMKGTTMVTRARIAWIAEVRKQIARSDPTGI